MMEYNCVYTQQRSKSIEKRVVARFRAAREPLCELPETLCELPEIIYELPELPEPLFFKDAT
jgi:hypothetical protein